MTPRQKLLALEKEGEYVFHGSTMPGLTQLKPKQAYHWLTKDTRVKDGPPGVAAAPYADPAIFISILSKGRSGWSSDGKGNIEFHTERSVQDTSKNAIGYVYVLAKQDFRPKSGHEQEIDWRSEKSIKPLQVIKVTYEDLPEGIEVTG